ncbi:unannotated protein [freshwater metagenome]|uniref:Unannotated protein n=1 Tax=freshwater metagenome TaxID=449393 RepID=A0A6J7W9V0_9ZZZZ|nr:NTP transferase domain-containing protein [Actinomycetota bacterium]MSW62167.1 NTP transferase domain-containing protein [Actinomycetota bacterium]MSX89246.1 NTP transferase domain-containing protein [Actinomycetota bacterium]MSZ63673.1 NTP transferase domain-containing protein [Actinomycetota bacterium]MTA58230.1 NTP transferase domain-containing protein [Actinomycetota bacterium]
MESKKASIIILSGGASKRFGSDKSQALIEGQRLIARILEAIPSEFDIIIVGPDPKIMSSNYVCVIETPPAGGPVAGFKAGLELCNHEIVGLIATDMPFALMRVVNLFNSMTPHDDGVMYVDSAGFRQPLAAVYRVDSVEKALAELNQVDGKSMRELISHLAIREIAMSHEVEQALMDIDTIADLDRAVTFAAKGVFKL